jgi:hypothetical protein
MRSLIPTGTILAVAITALTLRAARGETALDALRQLPKDQAARIAKIEGRDGSPDPERWYILANDPTADNGVHEFVVSSGTLVASRALSQFAQSLKPEDMLGDTPVKIDSDQAAKVAREYAETNGAAVAMLNYELKKAGPAGEPEWTVSCVDDKGNKVGEVVMTAEKGTVVSHDGFTLEPEVAAAKPEETPRKRLRVEAETKPEVAAAPVAQVASGPDDQGESEDTHRAHPAGKPQNAVVKTFDNVGRTLHKYLLPF